MLKKSEELSGQSRRRHLAYLAKNTELFAEGSDIQSPLDTRVRPHIRIFNGALDEDKDSSAGLVLQGRIDTSTLRFLKCDEYQRKLEYRADILGGYQHGQALPVIEIGVRDQDFVMDGDDFVIFGNMLIRFTHTGTRC